MAAGSYAIFGASGFGREVMPVFVDSLRRAGVCHDVIFVDDNPSAAVNGYDVVGYDEWVRRDEFPKLVSIAIASPSLRRSLAERCESDGVGFFEVRAADVLEMDSVKVGVGAILCPRVTLTSNIRIGRHFHCNIYSYVAHDCVIGDFVTFAPGVKCNGNVVIEDDVYVGTGAIIKQGRPGDPLVIGRRAVIGMGAVVTRSVPAGETVVGNPARRLIQGAPLQPSGASSGAEG
jgi:sugar O-acyltransferase (sialic acid O-acetyltransferase NeuD family)